MFFHHNLYQVGLIYCFVVQRNEGLTTIATSGTFLVEDGPYYFCMLEILLGRLSRSLFTQVLAVFIFFPCFTYS